MRFDCHGPDIGISLSGRGAALVIPKPAGGDKRTCVIARYAPTARNPANTI
jgi:hypothetical protein